MCAFHEFYYIWPYKNNLVMKNLLLFVFSITLLCFVTPVARAGFVVKNSMTKSAATISAASAPSNTSITQNDQQQKFSTIREIANHPIERWTRRGWVGILSVILGVAGFIYPFFGFGALLLGFIGMNGKRSKNTGVAIAGFVLGLIVVGLVIFGGFTGWGLY
jgi:hypothetical protein